MVISDIQTLIDFYIQSNLFSEDVLYLLIYNLIN